MPKFDTTKSKVKLWVGMPSNQENGIWFSFLTENKYSEKEIVERMTNRILNKKYEGQFTIAKFYNNHSGRLIKTIKTGISEKNNKISARIKLWIGTPDENENQTFYSFTESEDNEMIIKKMTDSILRDKYRFNFTKAMFFNNQTGLLIKTVNGNMIST